MVPCRTDPQASGAKRLPGPDNIPVAPALRIFSVPGQWRPEFSSNISPVRYLSAEQQASGTMGRLFVGRPVCTLEDDYSSQHGQDAFSFLDHCPRFYYPELCGLVRWMKPSAPERSGNLAFSRSIKHRPTPLSC